MSTDGGRRHGPLVGLLGPAEVRRLAEELDVRPTKKLGQNFVHDANTVRRIVRIAEVRDRDVVLEVGPGLGSLTLGLLEVGAHVVAVEIDDRLADRLPATVAEFAGDRASRLTVINEDALRVRSTPEPPSRLVANLPYNVSVPVLLHVLAAFPTVTSGVIMVQAEVGERLAARPGAKIYGVPSVKAAWYGEFRLAGQVGRQVFWPVPNVDSVLIHFERHEHRAAAHLQPLIWEVVDAAFGQRRKTLRQSLAGVAGGPDAAGELLRRSGLNQSERGERLELAQFQAIAEQLAARRRSATDRSDR